MTLPDTLENSHPDAGWESLGVYPRDIADLVALMRGNVEKVLGLRGKLCKWGMQ